MLAFSKVGHTSISMCEAPDGTYKVSAIGGRMFGNAKFNDRISANTFFNQLNAQATKLLEAAK